MRNKILCVRFMWRSHKQVCRLLRIETLTHHHRWLFYSLVRNKYLHSSTRWKKKGGTLILFWTKKNTTWEKVLPRAVFSFIFAPLHLPPKINVDKLSYFMPSVSKRFLIFTRQSTYSPALFQNRYKRAWELYCCFFAHRGAHLDYKFTETRSLFFLIK